MRRLSLLLTFCFCYLMSFAQDFEGTVKIHVEATMSTTSTMSVDGEVESEHTETEEINQNVVLKIKGDKTHMMIEDEEGVMVLITDKSTYDIIQVVEAEGKKQALKMNFKKQIEAQKNKEQDNDMVVTKTGKSKMIRDYLCYEYTVKDEDGSGTAWATSEINLNLDEQIPLPNEGSSGFLAPVQGIDGFIMQMNGTDKEGNEFVWEATVEETSIDDSTFEVELDEEAEKQMTKQEQMMKLAEEYRAKMMEASGDEEKLKQLADEMKKKMMEIQNQ